MTLSEPCVTHVLKAELPADDAPIIVYCDLLSLWLSSPPSPAGPKGELQWRHLVCEDEKTGVDRCRTDVINDVTTADCHAHAHSSTRLRSRSSYYAHASTPPPPIGDSINAVVTTTIRLRFDGRSTIKGH